MKKNMGTIDRVVRIIVALGIVALYFTTTMSTVVAVVLGIVAVAMGASAIVGSCPMYVPLGISTLKTKESESVHV